MKQMVCSVCSYTYDEAKGIPEAGMPQAGHCPPGGHPRRENADKDGVSLCFAQRDFLREVL